MNPFRARAPGLVTPWRWLDLVLFFVAAIIVIATSFRVRVYYKSPESPATELTGLWTGEPSAEPREASPDPNRAA